MSYNLHTPRWVVTQSGAFIFVSECVLIFFSPCIQTGVSTLAARLCSERLFLIRVCVCVCFSSGGADRQQRVWLHPPRRPCRNGRAAGDQAAPQGRGWLPHDPWERVQLGVHILPCWYPRTRFSSFFSGMCKRTEELNLVCYKKQKLSDSAGDICIHHLLSPSPQPLLVLIPLLTIPRTVASSSAWSRRSPREACTSSLLGTR